GEKLVLVAKVVLSKLAGRVALRLEQFRDGRILRAEPNIRAGQTYFGQACSDWRLSRDEGCAARGATLLAIPARKHCAFLADPIDIRRPISHIAAVIDARVIPPNIVAENDEDVGFLRLREGIGRGEDQCQEQTSYCSYSCFHMEVVWDSVG